jgi:hypothetical protein
MVQKYRKTSAYIKNRNKIRLYMKGGAKEWDEFLKTLKNTYINRSPRLALVCVTC